MEFGMTDTVPIELECWMLKWGILSTEDRYSIYGSNADVVWPKVKEDLTKVSQGWKPSYDGEEPPF